MADIPSIFDAHRVEYRRHGEHHHTSRGWVSVDCPNCSPNSRRFRLGFSVDGTRSNCWVCGRIDKAAVLSKLCHIPLGEAIGLCGKFSSKFEAYEPPTGTLKLPAGVGPLLPFHANYLKRRGFEPARLEEMWSIQGIGPGSKLQWRLFIPAHDRMGRVVSWTTRSTKSNGQRYITAEEDEEALPLKHLLYGAQLARQAVVICEGPIDAWAIGPGAVAVCGLSYTEQQLIAMSEYAVRVVCFDNEPDAQSRADDLCRRLSIFPGQTENVVLETGDDPADVMLKNPGEIEELRKTYLEWV